MLVMRYIFLCFLLCVFSFSAFSQVVGEIVVKGNKIIETAAIVSKINSKVNKPYKTRNVRKDVRSIFKTGWFHSVKVERKKAGKKVKLIYIVKERPVVEKIIYRGNRALSKKEMNEIFDFSLYEFLNYKKIKQAIEGVKKEYEKKGYYLVEIDHSIKKTSHPSKVRLIVNIKENKKVKIKRVNFIGNHSISSQEIKSFMGTREAGLLSFISSSGSYKKDILEKDLNNIRFVYMDRGYWKIFVGKPEILVSPDKTDITITIPIQEGDQYKAGSVNFSGDLIFNEEFLKEGIETEELEIFSYGKLQRDIKRIEAKYGDKGYAFVNVIPKFFNLPTDDGKTIHLLFDIQKGKKVQIGKIHISGNTYTRDKVIRREIRIFEGELYNETNKQRSVENIKRLGFFDDVKMIPKTIKNREDLVDMEVAIKERENTGSFQIGAAYEERYGFSLNAKIHKMNLFGRGYSGSIDTNLQLRRQYVKMDIKYPYFLDSKWYFGWDFYLDNWSEGEVEEYKSTCELYTVKNKEYTGRVTANNFGSEKERLESKKALDALEKKCLNSFYGRNKSGIFSGGGEQFITHRGFSAQTVSSGITFGRPLTDVLKLLAYYRLEWVRLRQVIDDDLYRTDFASGFRNPVEMIVEYDNRNDRLMPTGGIFSRASLAYDGAFSKFDYFTFSTNFRFYRSLFWDIVFRLNVQYSQHLALEGDVEEAVPVDRLFLLGGINSLRGFDYYSVGPRKRSEKVYQKALEYMSADKANEVSQLIYGGTKELYANIELQFPIFPEAQLLGVLFVDVGNAYSEIYPMDLRANWGLGVRFFSPLGPIRVEMGFPFSPKTELGESVSKFQFTFGLPF